MKKSKLLLFSLISILFVIGTDCSGLNKRRNIAFRRAVYQSSALNYNATGHLVTDGIFTVSKQKRHQFQSQFFDSPTGEGTDAAFDGKAKTKWLTFNNSTWLQIQFGDAKALKANYYKITSANDSPKRDPKDWVLEGSDDGAVFVELDKRGKKKKHIKYLILENINIIA